MTPSTDRKTEILDHAERLLLRVGYASFSYSDLSAAVAIAKPSIHHHFPTKEALGLALVERYFAELEGIRVQIAEVAPTPGGQLRAFLEYGHSRADSCSICPLGALQADFEGFPESLRERTRELTQAVHTWLAELLERAQQAGEVRYSGLAATYAWSLMSTLQGARQNARVAGAEVYDQVANQLIGELFVTAS